MGHVLGEVSELGGAIVGTFARSVINSVKVM